MAFCRVLDPNLAKPRHPEVTLLPDPRVPADFLDAPSLEASSTKEAVIEALGKLEPPQHDIPKLHHEKPCKRYSKVDPQPSYEVTPEELAAVARHSHGADLEVIDSAPIGLWMWEGCDENCVFCMDVLMSPCPECQNNGTPDQCSIAVGECSHLVHTHCQAQWTRSDSCMWCRRPWVPVKYMSVAKPSQQVCAPVERQPSS